MLSLKNYVYISPPAVRPKTCGPLNFALTELCLAWRLNVFVSWPVGDAGFSSNRRLGDNCRVVLKAARRYRSANLSGCSARGVMRATIAICAMQQSYFYEWAR